MPPELAPSGSANVIESGEIVGPYQVVRGFRGRGGMAQVYEVEVRKQYRQPGLPRRLALKVADEEHQAALVAEADYLCRFEHPNVVRILPLPGYHRQVYAAKERFDFGWRWYYAMELLDGGSLEQHLTRPTTVSDIVRRREVADDSGERALSLVEVLGIGRQLASALAHIHECSVINLDVKPANVLFRRGSRRRLRSSVPQAVLSDFGIARDPRRPRFGQLGMATAEYVSPEHAREIAGERVALDHRSDVFSLGVVLYEMLTGELPFASLGEVLSDQYVPVPPRQHRRAVPADLEGVVMRAIVKDPSRRYQSARQVKAALDDVRDLPDWAARGRRLFAVATVTAVVTGGAVGARRVWTEWRDGPSVTVVPVVATDMPEAAPTTKPAASATPSGLVFPDSTATKIGPTSTSRPTSTATPTPRPPTATPSLAPTTPAAPVAEEPAPTPQGEQP